MMTVMMITKSNGKEIVVVLVVVAPTDLHKPIDGYRLASATKLSSSA
jgi:hypothetical protein